MSDNHTSQIIFGAGVRNFLHSIFLCLWPPRPPATKELFVTHVVLSTVTARSSAFLLPNGARKKYFTLTRRDVHVQVEFLLYRKMNVQQIVADCQDLPTPIVCWAGKPEVSVLTQFSVPMYNCSKIFKKSWELPMRYYKEHLYFSQPLFHTHPSVLILLSTLVPKQLWQFCYSNS